MTDQQTADHQPGEREKIIAALIDLLAERRFEEIGFGAVATRAGVSLVQCREQFGSTLAVLAAHTREIDRKVLKAAGDPDVVDESPRERLFDVMMRRLEALASEKPAVRSLLRSASRNPPLALALNGLAVRSMQWMLTAADIDAAGPRGALRAQGLAVLFASVLRTWVDDDDPGLARTMAVLDRKLARGGRWEGMVDRLCRLAPTRCLAGGYRRSRRRHEPDLDLDESALMA